jgi:uncharacterized protein (DUF58 family)
VLAAAAVLGFGAWWLGYPELAVLSTGCLAAAAVGACWLLFGASLKITREVAPAKVPRGNAAIATVRVTNAGRRGTRPLAAVDSCGATTVRVELPGLARGASRFVSYRLETARRGEFPIGPLLLHTADPLGLVRRARAYGQPATLLVRPRTAALPMLASGRTASIEGPTSDTAPSGTVTFHALREYVMGDDLRHIHWRTTARTGTLMVRQLVDSSLPVTTVILDTRAASYPGEEAARHDALTEREFDIAVDAVATVAASMALAGFPVTLLTTDGTRHETRSARAAGALLDLLAVVETSQDGELATTLETARRFAVGGSLTVVTGLAGRPPADRLAACKRRFDRTIVIRAGRRADPRAGRAADARAGRAADVRAGRAADVPLTLPVTVINAASAEDVAAAWRRDASR